MCDLGLYERCATLACRARDLDPENDDARRLCHEATIAVERERSGDGSPSELEGQEPLWMRALEESGEEQPGEDGENGEKGETGGEDDVETP